MEATGNSPTRRVCKINKLLQIGNLSIRRHSGDKARRVLLRHIDRLQLRGRHALIGILPESAQFRRDFILQTEIAIQQHQTIRCNHFTRFTQRRDFLPKRRHPLLYPLPACTIGAHHIRSRAPFQP